MAEELTRRSGHSHEAPRKPGGPVGAGETRHGLRRVTDVSPGLRWTRGVGETQTRVTLTGSQSALRHREAAGRLSSYLSSVK